MDKNQNNNTHYGKLYMLKCILLGWILGNAVTNIIYAAENSLGFTIEIYSIITLGFAIMLSMIATVELYEHAPKK